jgi:F0F1-type ATP synthase membrane subunit b/b'
MIDYLTDPLFWIFLGWVFLPAIICYILALKKRRSTLFWLLAGMVLGLIAIVILYLLPKLEKVYKIPRKDRIDSKLKMYENLEEMNKAKQKMSEGNINES